MGEREFVEIDGSEGEGGGQILRSSLALSLITGRPVRLRRIRAGRKKPGLLRQHLTAVRAAAAIGSAAVEGDALRSGELTFCPGRVTHGERRFDVGSAGSATLVFQTVVWPLLCTPGRSRVTFTGGTHNPMAPPFEFIARVLAPLLRRMGARIDVSLERAGFYPAGGGRFVAEIEGSSLAPLELQSRGEARSFRAEALVANLPVEIADRQLAVIGAAFSWSNEQLHARQLAGPGPGNAVLIELSGEPCAELFSAFGERSRRAELVAKEAVDELREHLSADAPVGRHLADQLLIPLALAGGGCFRTLAPTLHTRTNAEIIARFLDRRVTFEREGEGRVYQVRVG
ncbi:MAG: RNA 3'-terminal phosphate cyclase [Nannocystaceae bacterium]